MQNNFNFIYFFMVTYVVSYLVFLVSGYTSGLCWMYDFQEEIC